MSKRVLVINEGYSDNLGDQAIRESAMNLFRDIGCEVDFAFYSNPSMKRMKEYDYSSVQTKKSVGLRLKYKENLIVKFLLLLRSHYILIMWYFRNKNIIQNIIKKGKYDYIVIGGGQLINSSYRMSPNMFCIRSYTWSKYAKKYSKLFYIGLGVADSFNLVEKFLYRKALSKAEKIWVRDKSSCYTVKNTFYLDSEVVPDIVFYSENSTNVVQSHKTALIGIYNYHEYSVKFKKDNISLNSYYEIWAEKVIHFMNLSYQVSLFYTTLPDAQETIQFREFMVKEKGINLQIERSFDVAELNNVLSKAEIVYSGRMHALIMAMNNGVKVEPFIISNKLQSFNDDYIDSTITPVELKNKIDLSVVEYFNKIN